VSLAFSVPQQDVHLRAPNEVALLTCKLGKQCNASQRERERERERKRERERERERETERETLRDFWVKVKSARGFDT
jgi:hypothetical protein